MLAITSSMRAIGGMPHRGTGRVDLACPPAHHEIQAIYSNRAEFAVYGLVLSHRSPGKQRSGLMRAQSVAGDRYNHCPRCRKARFGGVCRSLQTRGTEIGMARLPVHAVPTTCEDSFPMSPSTTASASRRASTE